MKCDICGLPDCARRRAWPDGSKCREYVAIRGAAPGPSLIPVGPPPKGIRPLAETWRLHGLVHACPHKLPRDLNAPGECGCIGICGAGKGDLPEGRTSLNNCVKCQEGG